MSPQLLGLRPSNPTLDRVSDRCPGHSSRVARRAERRRSQKAGNVPMIQLAGPEIQAIVAADDGLPD